MAILKKDFEQEQKYLKEVVDVIDKLIVLKEGSINNKKDSYEENRQYLWENKSSMDDAEIRMNLDAINQTAFVANLDIKYLNNLKNVKSSPYFGRVDFCDDKLMKIYIGIVGINNENMFYVYDWRTPIASLFYGFEKGNAFYDSPTGRVNGSIILKRQYKIENKTIIRCFDSSINIDDDYLQEILNSATTDKMKNIVTTIQKEQNKIIRNVDDDFLIVQGVAGSGKTSIALHRIAYLMYQNKDLSCNNILIFSPNDVFSKYISNVLPELGEDNVLQSTFSAFANSYLKGFKKIESFTSFLERSYSNCNVNVDNTLKKFCSETFKELNNFIFDYHNNFKITSNFQIDGKIVFAKEVNEMITSKVRLFSLPEKIDYLSEKICEKLHISLKNKNQIKNQLYLSTNCSHSIINIYKEFIVQNGLQFDVDQSKNLLYYEDMILMLYMFFEIFGYPYSNEVKQVVIDEVQDYSHIQLKILKKIFKRSSFTLLGDINQTINPYFKYEKLSTIGESLNVEFKYIEICKTYRSSEEIICYSNNILNIDNVCTVRKPNNMPVLFRNDNKNLGSLIKNDIELMQKRKLKKIAIITHDAKESQMLYEEIKDKISNVSLLSEKDQKLSNVVILPSYIAKGLEFDGVIAYNASVNTYSPTERNLFYVVCTRAQHCLIIYNEPKF